MRVHIGTVAGHSYGNEDNNNNNNEEKYEIDFEDKRNGPLISSPSSTQRGHKQELTVK